MNVKGKMSVEGKHGLITIVVADITPDDAKEILKSNTDNRNLREKRVKVYANDMAAGNWKSNGDSIVIGDDGVLKNGQHRLHACIKADTVLEDAIIVYSPTTQTTCYDLGAIRSVKDTAHFMGLNDKIYQDATISNVMSQLLKAKLHWETSARDFSRMEIIATITENYDACCFLREHITKKARQKCLRKSSVFAAIICAYNNGYSYDKLARFCEVYTSGVSLSTNEIVIVKLREYVISAHANTQLTHKDLYMRTQRALDSFEKNKNLTTCRYSETEYYSPNAN